MKLLHGTYELLFPFAVHFLALKRVRVIFLHDDVVGVEFFESVQDVTL